MAVTVAYKKERIVNTKATTLRIFFNVVSLRLLKNSLQDIDFSREKKHYSSFESRIIPHSYFESSKNQPSFVVSQSLSTLKEMKAMDQMKNSASTGQSASPNIPELDKNVQNFEREDPFVETLKTSIKLPFREAKGAIAMTSNNIEKILNYEREEPSIVINKKRVNIPFKIKENVEIGSELS